MRPKFVLYDPRKETLIVAGASIMVATFFILNTVQNLFLHHPSISSASDKTKCLLHIYLPESPELECFNREFSSLVCYELYVFGSLTQVLLLGFSMKLLYAALIEKPKDFALWLSLSSSILIYYILLGVFRFAHQFYNEKVQCNSLSILVIIMVTVSTLGTSVYSIYVVYCYWMMLIYESSLINMEEPHDFGNRIFTHAGGVISDEDPDRIIFTVQAPPSYDQHMAVLRELNKNIHLPSDGEATTSVPTEPPPAYSP